MPLSNLIQASGGRDYMYEHIIVHKPHVAKAGCIGRAIVKYFMPRWLAYRAAWSILGAPAFFHHEFHRSYWRKSESNVS